MKTPMIEQIIRHGIENCGDLAPAIHQFQRDPPPGDLRSRTEVDSTRPDW